MPVNIFDNNEFEKLKSKYENKAEIYDVIIRYDSIKFFNKICHMVEKDRKGEVVFAVFRKNKKVISVRSAEYDQGIFRIPTGGIRHGEDIEEALHREIAEELGLKVKVIDFKGVIRIKFSCGQKEVMFYSYLFVTEEIGGNLLVDATDVEVAEIVEADKHMLEEICNNLLSIKGKWHDWGIFRNTTTSFFLENFPE